MGFKDKVLNSIRFQEQQDDIYEEDYQYEESYEEEPRQKRFSGFGFKASDELEDGYNYDDAGMRIVLLQPNRFEEAQTIASNLLKNKVVVFDLHECDVETAINIVNFVSGAIFALNGSIQKINERGAIFVAVPASVAMDNELRESFGVDDYGPTIADWVNRTRVREDFIG